MAYGLIALIAGGLSCWQIGLALAVIAGLAKEAWDATGRGHVEAMDALATVSGGSIGAALVAAI